MAIEQFIPEEHDIDWLIARRDRLERDRDALLDACKYAVRVIRRQEVGMIQAEAVGMLLAAIELAEKEG